MEWESRPDGAYEARAGDLLYRLTPELRRRGIGVWRLRAYRLVALEPSPAFEAMAEARMAVRRLADSARGRADAEVSELLSRLMPPLPPAV